MPSAVREYKINAFEYELDEPYGPVVLIISRIFMGSTFSARELAEEISDMIGDITRSDRAFWMQLALADPEGTLDQLVEMGKLGEVWVTGATC